MGGKFNLELKVGIFAFIGLLVLTLAIFSISEIYIFRPGYHIKICFGFASGIDVGAVVRVAGIEAGEIRDIEMSYDKDEGKAKITVLVWLDEDVKIPRDSGACISISGLIGETYLEIVPGQDYMHLLKEGDTLTGRDPLSTETLMEMAHKVVANFDDVLGLLNEVLDEETKEALKETIHNFRDFSASLKVITKRLERGEGKLGAYLKPRRTDRKKSEPRESELERRQPRQNF